MRYFITGAVFIILSFTSHSQFELVDEDNLWVNQGGSWNGFNFTEYEDYYFFQGDTIINDTSYKKLFFKRISTVNSYSQGDILTASVTTNHPLLYYSAMRQEGANIYNVQPSSSNELLYLNLNLQVGDTISYLQIPDLVVESIENSVLDGQVIRKFNFGSHFIYEGIGGEFGLFKSFDLFIEGSSYLTCFTRNGESLSVGPYSSLFDCIPALPLVDGDLDGDGLVTSSDLSVFLSIYGSGCSGFECSADFNGDGIITSSDLAGFLAVYE